MNRSRITNALLLAFAAVSFAGCPPTAEATRDGGMTCSSSAECNPGGATCGDIRQCVTGFCTDTTTIVACRDGGYPDSGPTGNCATYEDCNPAPACGIVTACINFICDPTTQLEIPCADGGAPEAGDDAASEAGSSDAGAVDAAD
jgi:hypothetical protein